MSSIAERLNEIIKERFNKNVTSFATAMGFPVTTVSNYLNPKRKSKPNSDFLEAVVRIVKVNAYWLLTGEGKMFDNESKQDEHHTTVKELKGVNYNLNGGKVEIINYDKEQPTEENNSKSDELKEDFSGMSVPDLLVSIAKKEAHIERLLSSLEKKDEQLEKLISRL